MSITSNKKKQKPFVDDLELPSSYNRTYLTLIPRDPNWIYAYWELMPSAIEKVKQVIGPGHESGAYVLRVYDVSYKIFDGTNANHQFDIAINPSANNWYINIWKDNSTFCADIGLRLPDGRFYKITRSNFVTTPRGNPSSRCEDIWMNVEAGKTSRPYVFTERPKHSVRKGKKTNLTEDDVRQYYSQLSPLLKDVISARINRANAKQGHAPSDIELKSSKRPTFLFEKFTKRLRTGASEETLSSWSSESLQGGGRKFFFELGTELIVYGRTEPDAKVYFEGKQIELRNDGTFGMRLALPDGRIPLGFKAVSADGVDKREIITGAVREKTKYV